MLTYRHPSNSSEKRNFSDEFLDFCAEEIYVNEQHAPWPAWLEIYDYLAGSGL